MKETILLMGDSSSGKTTSFLYNEELRIKGLPPEETFLIEVEKSNLPVFGFNKMYKNVVDDPQNGNFMHTDHIYTIIEWIDYIIENRHDIKYIIVDDLGYTMSNMVFRRSHESGYALYNDVAKSVWELLQYKRKLRDGMFLIITMHVTPNELNGKLSPKIAGKALNTQFGIEGSLNVILTSKTVETSPQKYEKIFMTQDDTISGAKSPHGMFQDMMIPNDMGFVCESIEKFYNGEEPPVAWRNQNTSAPSLKHAIVVGDIKKPSKVSANGKESKKK